MNHVHVGHKGQRGAGQNAQGERYAPLIVFMVFYMPVKLLSMLICVLLTNLLHGLFIPCFLYYSMVIIIKNYSPCRSIVLT